MIDLHPNRVSDWTDCYFTKSKQAAKVTGVNPVAVWQVFQKHDCCFAGFPFVSEMFDKALSVHVVPEGTALAPLEPALLIKGHFQDLVEYETIYLGILARCTNVATNVRETVAAANGKPVLFFPARFDIPEAQEYDGYAAAVGGATGCATPMQTVGFNKWHTGHEHHAPKTAVGTMPHALIAAFNGDTAAAALAFAEARPNEEVWALVDFHNDCAKTAVEVYKAFQDKKMTSRLAGVRLDTSEKLADEGIQPLARQWSIDCPKGVCPGLVQHVRTQLNSIGAYDVKIAVSGGFTTEKIKMFEHLCVPVDVYAVGERFLRGGNAFTSDIVACFDNGNLTPCGKVGRELRTNGNLELVQAREDLDKFFTNTAPTVLG